MEAPTSYAPCPYKLMCILPYVLCLLAILYKLPVAWAKVEYYILLGWVEHTVGVAISVGCCSDAVDSLM